MRRHCPSFLPQKTSPVLAPSMVLSENVIQSSITVQLEEEDPHLKETSDSRDRCSPRRHQRAGEGAYLCPSTKIHYCHTAPQQAPGMRSWFCRRKASKTDRRDWMVPQLGGFYDHFCQTYWAVFSLSNLTQLLVSNY